MKKITVYGSLLKGLGNSGLLRTSELLITEDLDLKFKMGAFGSAFPGLTKTEEVNSIHTETYEVDDFTYQRIESLEGYPSFYNRASIDTGIGKSEIYFIDNEGENLGVVEKINGVFNWRLHLENEDSRSK